MLDSINVISWDRTDLECDRRKRDIEKAEFGVGLELNFGLETKRKR